MTKEKKLKVRIVKVDCQQPGNTDYANISVSKGFGVAQKDFDINVYADDGGIRIEVNNEDGNTMGEQEWSWDDLIEED